MAKRPAAFNDADFLEGLYVTALHQKEGPRDAQRVFFEKAIQCVETGKSLLAELGTGTGKTNCALSVHVALKMRDPAHKTIVVAGGTKSLQRQYTRKAMQLPSVGSCFVRFGKSNYMCSHRLSKFLNGVESKPDEFLQAEWERMQGRPAMSDPFWATEQSERWFNHAHECGMTLEESNQIWEAIQANESCKCRPSENSESLEKKFCPAAVSHLWASKADLLIVNFAFLTARAAYIKSEDDSLYDRLWILDEFHELPAFSDALYKARQLKGLSMVSCLRLHEDLMKRGSGNVPSDCEAAAHMVVSFLDLTEVRREICALEEPSLMYHKNAQSVCRAFGKLNAKKWEKMRNDLQTVSKLLCTFQMPTEQEFLEALEKAFCAGVIHSRDKKDLNDEEQQALSGYASHIAFSKWYNELSLPTDVQRFLNAHMHVAQNNFGYLSRGNVEDAHRAMKSVVEGICTCVRASRRDTWLSGQEASHAPVVSKSGIHFELPPAMKAELLGEFLSLSSKPPLAMSATLRDERGSFDLFQSKLGKFRFDETLTIESPWWLDRSEPAFFHNPSSKDTFFPQCPALQDSCLMHQSRVIAHDLRLAPSDRDLAFVISPSKATNGKMRRLLSVELPDYEHIGADESRPFDSALQSKGEKPCVLYGVKKLAIGVDCPGRVSMVVLLKPLNASLSPMETYIKDNCKGSHPVFSDAELQQMWAEYYFATLIFFRQSVGRLIRTPCDSGVVLFFNGMNAFGKLQNPREKNWLNFFGKSAADETGLTIRKWPW